MVEVDGIFSLSLNEEREKKKVKKNVCLFSVGAFIYEKILS
jgi:hypothetical protein